MNTSDSTFTSFNLTCGDSAKPMTTTDTPFYDANFYVSTNPVKYGSPVEQNLVATVGSTISFRYGNMKHILFKNQNAGSNGVIYCTASVPTTYLKQQLGVL